VKPGSSWLCPTANHRERFLDMQERLRTARIVTLTTLSATAAIISATGGWIMLVAAAAAVVAVAVGGAASIAGAGPSCGSSPRPSSCFSSSSPSARW
jgi:hypothetical protein